METEKQYAIEQFLAVPAPKESRVRTLSELIERTFAAAHVRLEDVRWKATRRGLEPWKITAEFDSAGHAARAEWSWNMHDNAVNCLNAMARKLIGEQDTPAEGHAEKQVDQNFLAVSAWNAPEPVAPQATNIKTTVETQPSATVPLPNRPEIATTQYPAPSTTEPAQNSQNTQSAGEQQSDKSKMASSDPHSQSTTKSKRRAGRSAVPSWDEILFGD